MTAAEKWCWSASWKNAECEEAAPRRIIMEVFIEIPAISPHEYLHHSFGA
jgi:hypothetical protein